MLMDRIVQYMDPLQDQEMISQHAELFMGCDQEQELTDFTYQWIHLKALL